MVKDTKKENNKYLLIGLIAIVVVVGVYYGSIDDLQTGSIVVEVETPDNIAVVGNTQITCPEGYTVKTHLGGVQGTAPVPFCQAPNPSLDTFECGDSLIVDGVQHMIECVTVP